MARKQKKRKKQKPVKPDQARRAIYYDFEGRKKDDPVLLGVLFDENPGGHASWVLRQFVSDETCVRVDQVAGGRCEAMSMEAALELIIDFSDAEKRHLISWSIYDREVAKRLANRRSFRYRNTIPTVKRWRRTQREAGTIIDDGSADNTLSLYESLIGYDRPAEPHPVGTSIGYIRGLKSVTPGAIERWATILTHNEHDLVAMRDVMFTVFGIGPER